MSTAAAPAAPAAPASNPETVTKSFTDLVGELTSVGASIKEAVAELNKPQYKAHAGDGAMSYWEGEDTMSVAVPSDGPKPMSKAQKRLPKGYKNEHFKSAGQFYQEFVKAYRSGNVEEFRKKYETCFKAVQGMSEQVGSEGGWGVLPEFNLQILELIYGNDILSRTDQYTVNNNIVFLANAETSRATGSRNGGLQGFWTDEGATMTKSKPTLRRIELSLKKMAVVVYLTEELLADTQLALQQYIARKVAEEFNFMAGDAIFNGSGVQMPLGFLNSPALLAITKESGQAADTIVARNIDKMWMRRQTGGSYAWYHNQDCGVELDNLVQEVGTAGVPLYRPGEGIAGVAPRTLKNAPRVETEFNATLGDAGDLTLADLGQYITISKGGINQSMSTHVEFLTDQLALKFTMRMNGRPWQTTPITPYKGSNTQASFLCIEAR
jgi:HK97 family phage major capsid protein